MRSVYHALAAAVFMALLAGCNTDGLTPQAEIPGASQTTQPTQVDQQTEVAEVPQDRKPMIDSEPDQTSTVRSPQNTLEAQAQAIESGQDNPSETKAKQTGNLGANLYKTDADNTKVASLYSAKATEGSIRFLPIIGAPVQAVTPLSKELGVSARGNGLTIKSSSDQTAQHVLKGYLSAFSDGDKVTVVYVWDVLDNAGGRLHRIQGQANVTGGGGDAWASVPATVMQEIGVNTIAEYMKWKQTQG
ncbi:hypothetical protein IHQ71_17685 [Rhizobium sp. TH2]|nr:hypothetical protein IHQ71_17685 [Rhizobium sp. TH2]